MTCNRCVCVTNDVANGVLNCVTNGVANGVLNCVTNGVTNGCRMNASQLIKLLVRQCDIDNTQLW